MRIVSLDVQRFGCIKRAQIEFARGLNVVYGANDVGKSTLVQAVRAALLLPHNSSAYRSFVPWQEPDAVPEVVLTFQVTEAGSPRFYRVRKLFGQSAHLEWSNDGSSFSHDKAAREVDEKLRHLLQWGVPAAGTGRGMPESFLVKVLMASQPEATGILAAALADDKDPSGKQRIVGAVEAMMEAPLFKKVLDRALRRVNEAFSSTGRKRTGKDSPWIEARDKINKADMEVTKLQTQRDQSSTVLAKLRHLDEEVFLHEEALSDAKRKQAGHAARWVKQQELETRKGQVALAEAEFATQLKKVTAMNEAVIEDGKLVEAVAAARATEQEAGAVAEAAQLAVTAVEDRVRQLESADAIRDAQLKESQLRERQTKLQADIDGYKRESELVQNVATKHSELTTQQTRVAEFEHSFARGELEVQRLQQELDAATETYERKQQILQYWRYRDVVLQLEQAEATEKTCSSLRQEAVQQREQAASIEAELASMQLPDATALRNLQELRRRLESQQAALELGLTAVVTPTAPPLKVEVISDGEATHMENLIAAVTFSGRRSLQLNLPGAAVTLSVGSVDSVRALEELRSNWRTQGAPALKAANVTSFAELEAMINTADFKRVECSRLKRSAGEKEDAANNMLVQATRVQTLRKQAETGTRVLAEFHLADLDEQAKGYSDEDQISKALAVAEEKKRQLESANTAASISLHSTSARLETARAQLAAIEATYRDATVRVPADWATQLVKLTDSVKALQAEKVEVDEALMRLSVQQDEHLESARAKRIEVQTALRAASAVLEQKRSQVRELEKDLDQHRGRLMVLREAVNATDLDGAQESLKRLVEGYAVVERECLAAGPLLREQDLDAASAAVTQAAAVVREKLKERDEARGGLMEVGGDVVEEELNDAVQALVLRKRELEELEVEYGAWQLLKTTLEGAEKSEGTNLGEILGPPLQTRFAELTGGRYQQLAVGADLRTEGFLAAGEVREVTALSTGTQEQLSTIFRLCLAETLETAVILDDHLSQTDSKKMQWFRIALDDVARKSQIVVISCWPEHYQLPVGAIDTARKIDAAARVERYSS